MARERLVLLGFGMAGAHLLTRLAELCYGGDVVVFGAEPDAAYNRIDLAARALGGPDPQPLLGKDALAGLAVEHHLGLQATSIDRDARLVHLADGSSCRYDKLVLALGADPVRPPVVGLDLPGVHFLRSLADARNVHASLRGGMSVLVLGGGAIGLETAESCLNAGHRVVLIQAADRVLEAHLDGSSARWVEARLRARGLILVTGAPARRFTDNAGRLGGVELMDGTRFPADLAIVCTGVSPRTELARSAGLVVNRGIVVDASMATSDANVFAVGDCCECENAVAGLIEPAYAQAKTAALTLCGRRAAWQPDPGPVVLLKTQLPLLAVGEPHPENAALVEFQDPVEGVSRRLWLRDGKIASAVLVGHTAGFSAVERYFRAGSEVPRPVFDLFGPADASNWPDSLELCGCHAVTAADVRSGARGASRAGSGCGACRESVAELRATLTEGSAPPRLVKGYPLAEFVSHSVDWIMAAGFVVSLVTGVLKFPGLLGALGISLRTMPMPLIMDLHDWGSLAFTAAALVHLVLHWRPLIRFGADLFRQAPKP